MEVHVSILKLVLVKRDRGFCEYLQETEEPGIESKIVHDVDFLHEKLDILGVGVSVVFVVPQIIKETSKRQQETGGDPHRCECHALTHKVSDYTHGCGV